MTLHEAEGKTDPEEQRRASIHPAEPSLATREPDGSKDPRDGTGRIEGLDVARALAILGMVLVHFTLVMTDGTVPSRWSGSLLAFLDGRPAATFMILAGLGVSLMRTRTRQQGQLARTLRRRGLFLLCCGTLNLMIWEGDILRVYGVSLMLVPMLLWTSQRILLAAGVGSIAIFCVLMATFDYGRHWDWGAMKYHGLWTPGGFLSNLTYDGFRGIFPWSALFVFGIWLGRLDLSGKEIATRLQLWGAIIWLASGLLSIGLRAILLRYPQPGLDRESVEALFGLQSMPPLPLFLVNASAVAMIVIGSSIRLANRAGTRWPIRALAATGRMAFTWYVAHIILGLGGIILLGWLKTTALEAFIAAFLFFIGACGISVWWMKVRGIGPLEFLLRRVQ